jgi:quinol monooxygenase YgiN
MYARITKYQCDPSRLDEMTAKIDEIKTQVKEISGVVSIYSAWRADGNGITTAIYESQAAADASTAQAQAIWASMADLLVGAPEVETYENVERITG